MWKEIRTLLNSEDEADRLRAIEQLTGLRHPGAIFLLARRMEKESSAFVRRRLISALGNIRHSCTAALAARQLASPDAAVRNGALEILQNLGETALPALREIMDHHSYNIRKMTADILARVPGDAAFSLLVNGLRDYEPNVSGAFAEALGNRRDRRAVPVLLATLRQTADLWVAFSVIEALAKIGEQLAMADIHHFVNGSGWSKQERAVLGGIWAYAAGRLDDGGLLPAAWIKYSAGDLSTPEMVVLLYQLQQRGIDISSGRDLENLLSGQLSGEGTRETLAAVHLAASHCPGVLLEFLPLLVEKYAGQEEVLEELSSALVETSPSSSQLNGLVQGAGRQLLELVLSAAEQSNTALDINILKMLAASTDEDLTGRAIALAWRCGDESIEFLLENIDFSRSEVACSALEGLGKLGAGVVPHLLLQALEHSCEMIRQKAADIITTINPPGIRTEIERFFEHCPDYARPEVLEVMLSLKGFSPSRAFQLAAATSDPAVRVKVAKICKKINSMEVFIAVMETLANDPDQEVRRQVIRSLCARSGQEVYRLLAYLYENDPCRMHRYHILGCPEIYRHVSTFEWLVENLNQPEFLLRLAAVRGMGRMGEKGRQYLQSMLEFLTEADVEFIEAIRQELRLNGGRYNDPDS